MKIVVLREELSGITDYDTFEGYFEDAQSAQEHIDDTVKHLTTREANSCKIYALEIENDNEIFEGNYVERIKNHNC